MSKRLAYPPSMSSPHVREQGLVSDWEIPLPFSELLLIKKGIFSSSAFRWNRCSWATGSCCSNLRTDWAAGARDVNKFGETMESHA